jgi:glycosyl transferase family 25
MWDFVEKVIYINLDERTDRRAHMERMTKTFGDKVIRLPGIKDSWGIVGCGKSHKAALQMALDAGWKNVMIMEDDAEWNEFYPGYHKLENIVKNPFDVVMLGGTAVYYYPENYRLHSAQCASAYLVNSHYIPTLISNLEDALTGLVSTRDRDTYSNDMYWKRLQARDTWYIVMPPLVYQMPSYSNIEERDVDYTAFYGVTPKTQSVYGSQMPLLRK